MRFCRFQNLRNLFCETHLPTEAHPIITTIEKRYRTKVHGTILSSSNGSAMQDVESMARLVTLSNQDYALLVQWFRDANSTIMPSSKVTPVKSYKRFNQTFQALPSRESASLSEDQTPPKNSVVMVTLGDGTCIPAVLQSIFSPTRVNTLRSTTTETFFTARKYEPLSATDTTKSYCLKFPLASGHLYYNSLCADTILAPIDRVVAHAALTPQTVNGINRPCVHILPLVT